MVQQREPGDPIGGLIVGIVTNMPPATTRMTERQYRCLINRAAPGGDVELRHFVHPDQLSDVEEALGSGGCYESLDALWGARLDALIIAGAEPQAASMLD